MTKNKLSPNEEKVCLLLGKGIMSARQIQEKSYKPLIKTRDNLIASRILPVGATEQQYLIAIQKIFPSPLFGGDLQAVLRRMVKKGILCRELVGGCYYYKVSEKWLQDHSEVSAQ